MATSFSFQSNPFAATIYGSCERSFESLTEENAVLPNPHAPLLLLEWCGAAQQAPVRGQALDVSARKLCMTGRFAVLVTMVACSSFANITNIVISRLTISYEVEKESLSVKRRFSPQRRLAENPEILGSDACHYKASRSPTRRHSLTLFSGGGVQSMYLPRSVKVRSHEWEGGSYYPKVLGWLAVVSSVNYNPSMQSERRGVASRVPPRVARGTPFSWHFADLVAVINIKIGFTSQFKSTLR
ncbi:hypothetical protein DER46DRAFT_572293 [Fusarium sp. MPI-SDFR-AT-0072]|nr:hypothetical protein DER46DRAFT_572293 [Fusarium sp. MPI-SDFR-AT-0072]